MYTLGTVIEASIFIEGGESEGVDESEEQGEFGKEPLGAGGGGDLGGGNSWFVAAESGASRSVKLSVDQSWG